MKRLALSIVKVFSLGASLALSSITFATPSQTTLVYKITVSNVTAGNAISPFLVVAHAPSTSLFTPGMEASPGVAAIAETGNTSILEEALSNTANIVSVAKAEGGPILPANSGTATLSIPYSRGSKLPVLTLLAMIGKSNDSFVSLRNLNLRRFSRLNQTMTLFAQNFDAGSEENTGNVEDFGPGGHPTENAEGFISYDRGLNLRGDAPEIIAWGPKVAKVSITRIQ